jgi:hypothetical protein
LSGVDKLHDILLLQNLFSRFANSFDLKTWDDLETCLAPSVHTDYSDLRGTPPEVMSNVRFVELRRNALQDLATHHLFGNHEIDIDSGHAHAKVSAVIYRKNTEGIVLNTHCIYLFEAQKIAVHWKITAITQKVLWSDGDIAIHAGIAKK